MSVPDLKLSSLTIDGLSIWTICSIRHSALSEHFIFIGNSSWRPQWASLVVSTRCFKDPWFNYVTFLPLFVFSLENSTWEDREPLGQSDVPSDGFGFWNFPSQVPLHHDKCLIWNCPMFFLFFFQTDGLFFLPFFLDTWQTHLTPKAWLGS